LEHPALAKEPNPGPHFTLLALTSYYAGANSELNVLSRAVNGFLNQVFTAVLWFGPTSELDAEAKQICDGTCGGIV
jgi:hypothetical protein